MTTTCYLLNFFKKYIILPPLCFNLPSEHFWSHIPNTNFSTQRSSRENYVLWRWWAEPFFFYTHMRESCFYKRGWNASSNLQCLPGSFVCSPRFLCISRACISEPSWFCLYKSGPVAKENGRMRHSDPQVGMKVTFQQLWENLPRSGCRRLINGPLYLLDFRVVCVCVVLGTRRSACAQTFQWERCLDEAGLRCVCRWARVCIWMNHTLDLWSNVSLVFFRPLPTLTHTHWTLQKAPSVQPVYAETSVSGKTHTDSQQHTFCCRLGAVIISSQLTAPSLLVRFLHLPKVWDTAKPGLWASLQK